MASRKRNHEKHAAIEDETLRQTDKLAGVRRNEQGRTVAKAQTASKAEPGSK